LKRLVGLLALLAAAPAQAGGRWYAWLDRVPAGAGAAALARWRAKVPDAEAVPSERFQGVEDGYTYVLAGESLFESEARARVGELTARGVERAGVQYFSDRRPAGLDKALGLIDHEPLFTVETDVDGGPPTEVLVLSRHEGGALFHVVQKHQDGTLTPLANHPVPLYGLPGSTQGERARAFPLRRGGLGQVVVFEAAFDTGTLQGLWTLLFVVPDLQSAPRVFVVPGALAPVRSRFEPGATPDGAFAYTITVDGPKAGQSSARKFAWSGETFVEAK
jgi:hypothetical protein